MFHLNKRLQFIQYLDYTLQPSKIWSGFFSHFVYECFKKLQSDWCAMPCDRACWSTYAHSTRARTRSRTSARSQSRFPPQQILSWKWRYKSFSERLQFDSKFSYTTALTIAVKGISVNVFSMNGLWSTITFEGSLDLLTKHDNSWLNIAHESCPAGVFEHSEVEAIWFMERASSGKKCS